MVLTLRSHNPKGLIAFGMSEYSDLSDDSDFPTERANYEDESSASESGRCPFIDDEADDEAERSQSPVKKKKKRKKPAKKKSKKQVAESEDERKEQPRPRKKPGPPSRKIPRKQSTWNQALREVGCLKKGAAHVQFPKKGSDLYLKVKKRQAELDAQQPKKRKRQD